MALILPPLCFLYITSVEVCFSSFVNPNLSHLTLLLHPSVHLHIRFKFILKHISSNMFNYVSRVSLKPITVRFIKIRSPFHAVTDWIYCPEAPGSPRPQATGHGRRPRASYGFRAVNLVSYCMEGTS